MCGYVRQIDLSALTGNEALRGLREMAAIKNAAAAGEALFAARLAETQIHRGTGAKSAADFIAGETGTTAGRARDTIETGKRLEDQPDLNDAARSGEVSPEQLNTISDAAAADPTAEKDLLNKVRGGASLNEIRDAANKVKADALADREARRKKIHAERSFRTWTDGEGTGHLHMTDNPEVIATLAARVDEETEQIFHERRREGAREPRQAYAADALVRLVCGGAAPSKGSTRAKVIFRVDWPAWLRGWPRRGEVMELVGYGPVAASAIDDAIAAGGFIAAVMTKGEQLTGVAHLKREPTAKQQTGLEWLYPTCAAAGCNAVARLQRDHRVDWARSHITMVDWLDLLCAYHHGLKTTKNWMLVEGAGKRPFVPPDDARHPGDCNAHAPPAAAL